MIRYLPLLALLFAAPVLASDVPAKLMVAATIALDEEILSKPRLVVEAGHDFKVKVGKEGERIVTLSGMVAPINARAAAVDYTLELELPGKLGMDIRRMSQTVRLNLDESLEVGSLKDAEGRTLRLTFKVSSAP
ncbi:MAG: hypothetical protein JNM76_15305 [Betaproteobacteria bacterium]|nr:hypothetical protein [Betaproteobacteria bacterium]